MIFMKESSGINIFRDRPLIMSLETADDNSSQPNKWAGRRRLRYASRSLMKVTMCSQVLLQFLFDLEPPQTDILVVDNYLLSTTKRCRQQIVVDANIPHTERLLSTTKSIVSGSLGTNVHGSCSHHRRARWRKRNRGRKDSQMLRKAISQT